MHTMAFLVLHNSDDGGYTSTDLSLGASSAFCILYYLNYLRISVSSYLDAS